METPWNLVLRAALGGGAAGAIAAAHAWNGLAEERLQWHVVPAGLLHGALLAAVAVLASARVEGRGLAARLVAVPLAGWVGGFLSFAPLATSLEMRWIAGSLAEQAWMPFFEFGLVTSLAVLGWSVVSHLRSPRLAVHVAVASVAGVLGSAWWWFAWEHGVAWRFVPLHGVLWGTLVGVAVWTGIRSGQPRAILA